jgi:branched-chain amino acid transport system substrate-binding protein
MLMRYAAMLVALLLVLAGATAPRAGAAGDADEIRVGIAMPLSGPLLASGARSVLAATTAVEALNGRGGVLGRPVRLIAMDDECGEQAAVDAAGRLVAAGVVMVVGHLCSHSSLLAAAIYDIAGILMFMPDSTHPRLTEENRPNVFRLIGRDDLQGAAAAELIAKRWPDRRLALVHDGSLYGQRLALETRRALQQHGVTLALFDRYAAGDVDHADLVRRLGANGIELLFVAGYGPDAGRIASDAEAAGLDLQLLGGDGLGVDEFAAAAGEAAEGTIFSTFSLRAGNPDGSTATPELLADFATGGLGSYAAIEVWSEAVARAGSLELERVTAVLRRGRFATVRGSLSFDAKGDLADSGWAWRVWRDGKAIPLE